MNQLISLILIFFCVNSSAQDQPIARLDHSGKIDLPLMEKLKYQRVNLDQITFDVLIVFDVDSSIARNERSLVELNQVNTKHANDIMQRQVAGGEFYLRRQFKSINALAATVSVQGLLNLVQDNRVVKVGLDAGGGGGLAEAIPQVSIDNVRRTYDLTGVGIEVAVLDTGIDIDHQDLQGVVLSQKCFADVCPKGSDNAEDDNGHGTHVTGIIASLGNSYESGGAPGVGIHAIKVLDANNSYSSASIILAGLDYIINELPSVNIVNMSLGTRDLFSSDCDTAYAYTAAFSSAINTLRSRGTLSFVASMNNASENTIAAPACIANAIAVGAVWDSSPSSYFGNCTDVSPKMDEMTCFSNTSVSLDMLAPGGPITSLRSGGGIITYSGTSMATPMAAACAALMLEKDPSSMPNRIELLLKTKTSVFVNDAMNRQFPRIDCFQAIRSMNVISEPAGILDIDVNGQFDALTDGLLLLRSMFGIEGNALILDAVAPDAYYQSVGDISQQIASVTNETDIDGDGNIDALTDGILILRYLFGLEGQMLVDGVVADGATRTTEQIEEYLASLVLNQ